MFIQVPNASKLLFIFDPSCDLIPRSRPPRSLPAKSTKVNLEYVISSLLSFSLVFCSTIICSKAWDLDENWFWPILINENLIID